MPVKKEHIEQYRALGIKLSYYRKMRGMSQAELAEKIGKTTGFIGMVEAPNMNKGMSLDTLFDIAKVQQIPAYQFLMYDEIKPLD